MCSILIVSLLLKLILFRENQRRQNLTSENHQQELIQCGAQPCDSVSGEKDQILLPFTDLHVFQHPDFRYIT